jgi:hypothetical protein
VARTGEKMYRVLVVDARKKRPLGRPRNRWEDGIKMNLREIGCGKVRSVSPGPEAPRRGQGGRGVILR